MGAYLANIGLLVNNDQKTVIVQNGAISWYDTIYQSNHDEPTNKEYADIPVQPQTTTQQPQGEASGIKNSKTHFD